MGHYVARLPRIVPILTDVGKPLLAERELALALSGPSSDSNGPATVDRPKSMIEKLLEAEQT